MQQQNRAVPVLVRAPHPVPRRQRPSPSPDLGVHGDASQKVPGDERLPENLNEDVEASVRDGRALRERQQRHVRAHDREPKLPLVQHHRLLLALQEPDGHDRDERRRAQRVQPRGGGDEGSAPDPPPPRPRRRLPGEPQRYPDEVAHQRDVVRGPLPPWDPVQPHGRPVRQHERRHHERHDGRGRDGREDA
eukprot:31095-Pelagococcus_subviridis.AAC.5